MLVRLSADLTRSIESIDCNDERCLDEAIYGGEEGRVKAGPARRALCGRAEKDDQWNCSSSVEPVSAVTDEAPPWITVVMSSKYPVPTSC